MRANIQTQLHSSLAFGLQTPSGSKDETEFIVKIVHNDEVAFAVYDKGSSKLLEGATVEIWTEKENKDNSFTENKDSRTSQKTDNFGSVKFTVKQLQDDKSDKFYMCFRVSKSGYETYDVRYRDT